MSDRARLALLGGGIRHEQVGDALDLGQVQLPQLRAPRAMHLEWTSIGQEFMCKYWREEAWHMAWDVTPSAREEGGHAALLHHTK